MSRPGVAAAAVSDLDDDGTIVRTAAWDEMASLINAPLPHQGSYVHMSWDDKIANQYPLSNEQIFKLV